ncbi:MAG: hypothetical protein NVS9B3_01810 [Gemmatimonadaceae bacterium]
MWLTEASLPFRHPGPQLAFAVALVAMLAMDAGLAVLAVVIVAIVIVVVVLISLVVAPAIATRRHGTVIVVVTAAAMGAVATTICRVTEDHRPVGRPVTDCGRAVGGSGLAARRHPIDPDTAHPRGRTPRRLTAGFLIAGVALRAGGLSPQSANDETAGQYEAFHG